MLTRTLPVRCRSPSRTLVPSRPAGWAPRTPAVAPTTLFFARTRIATRDQCAAMLRRIGQLPRRLYNTTFGFCVSVDDQVAFCGGDSGGAMYTIEREGGKATARVHGIFSVRFSLLRPPLVGGRGGRGGGTRTGALVRVVWREPSTPAWRGSANDRRADRQETTRRHRRVLCRAWPPHRSAFLRPSAALLRASAGPSRPRFSSRPARSWGGSARSSATEAHRRQPPVCVRRAGAPTRHAL